MKAVSTAALSVLFGLQLQTHVTLADGALAIGMPKGGIKNGMVYGFATGDDAENIAMRYCRGQEKENNQIPEHASKAQAACKIVTTFKDECIAVALNGGQKKSATGYGWAAGATAQLAKQRAISKCKEMADGDREGECYVQNSTCDGSAQ